MGRPKAGTNKSWAAKKFNVIIPILGLMEGMREVSKKTGISIGMISHWVNSYLDKAIQTLENKNIMLFTFIIKC